MDYISVKEASELWGMDASNIGKLLRKGRIDGAIMVAGGWLIPKGAQKPIDGRTRGAKSEKKASPFRFPLLVNGDEDSFFPELTEDEKRLRKAELDFYACDFDKAKEAFDKLRNDTNSIYIKITALFYLCSLSVEMYGGRDFRASYNELRRAFEGDFPYRKEMGTVFPWLYSVLVQYTSVTESLNFKLDYGYSPTVLPLLSYLSFYHIAEDLQAMTKHTYSDSYELLCRQLEQSGAYYEACEAHFALFCAYYLTLNESAMLYHLKKGMDIAAERNLPLIPASYQAYYPDAFEMAEGEYPTEFIEKIKLCAEKYSRSFTAFTSKYDVTRIYSRLSKGDYRYLLLALNGCTNRHMARIMNVSERTVTNRFSEIFDKLGVNSKKELIKLTDYRLKE